MHSSIVIGADDRPIIAYYDETTGNLKVFRCSDSSCFGGNGISYSLDYMGNPGEISIVIGSDGLPILSYYNNIDDDLKVFKCSDTACSSGN